MGHSGSQKADARELFIADHLARAELHLPVEIVSNFLETLSHIVESISQLGHFISGIQRQSKRKITRRHPTRTVS